MLVGNATDDGSTALQVNGAITTKTPAQYDNTTKAATTAFVLTNAMPLRAPLGAGVDLNAITESGIYHQSASANTTSAGAANYPVPVAGRLEVYASGWMVYQTYTRYDGGTKYTRSWYNGTWYPWKQMIDASVGGTISGSLSFSGHTDFTGGINTLLSNGVSVGTNGSAPDVLFVNNSGPTDSKRWDIVANATQMQFRTVNDAWTTGVPWMTATRSGNALTTLSVASSGGRVLVGTAVDDGTNLLQVAGTSKFAGDVTFNKTPTAPTPAAGNVSGQLSTTQFVATAILNDRIGQIVYEPRNSVRAGYLKLNGALVKRADYPALWAYAQASGALATEAAWTAGSWGCFSSGDGATTFRIPELRGEHIRCWDDGRGVDSGRAIGAWQDSQNRSHAHGATSAAVGDHVHSAWTDAQGAHAHGGATYAVGDHQHSIPNNGSAQAGTDNGGSPSPAATGYGTGRQPAPTGLAGGHAHGINTDGYHGHNVGIGAAGGHAHTITVNADGGTETRVRSVALLAMIRAY